MTIDERSSIVGWIVLITFNAVSINIAGITGVVARDAGELVFAQVFLSFSTDGLAFVVCSSIGKVNFESRFTISTVVQGRALITFRDEVTREFTDRFSVNDYWHCIRISAFNAPIFVAGGATVVALDTGVRVG